MARNVHTATATPRTAQVAHPPVMSCSHPNATPATPTMPSVAAVHVRDVRMKGA